MICVAQDYELSHEVQYCELQFYKLKSECEQITKEDIEDNFAFNLDSIFVRKHKTELCFLQKSFALRN